MIDFWATWCGPCVASIPHLNELVMAFAGQPVRFLSVTDEEPERIEEFLATHPMEGWIGLDGDRSTFDAFDVVSRPHTVVVDQTGRIAAITMPKHVTRAALNALLEGRRIDLPEKERTPSNLSWDREEIEWTDGVEPLSQVIIKPIRTATGGMRHAPGSNRMSADGAGLVPLIAFAFEVDTHRMDFRLPKTSEQYRVSVRVPTGREKSLRPVFQSALRATFGFQTRWEAQKRDVYLLRIPEGRNATIQPSRANEAAYSFMRGAAKGVKQPLDRLCDALTNFLRRPVLDETGLQGTFDWNLRYQPGDPSVVIREVQQKLGLELIETNRSLEVLVVE